MQMKKESTRERAEKLIIGALFFFAVLTLICGGVFLYVMLSGCGDGKSICALLRAEDEKSAMKSLGAALKILGGGSLTLLGVWVANRRAAAMERTAQAQADRTKEQAKSVKETEKGRQQERFQDAANRLGDESESVRLGGAYALFHLALEEESLRQSIAEILCAHIRETTRGEQYRKDYEKQPSTEIQSLMALLFEGAVANKNETLKKFWKDISPPDLSGSFFRGIKIWGAQFERAFLNDAQFQEAEFWGKAQFQKANLSRTQFERAEFRGEAQFQGADLPEAQFQKAHLKNARFQKANLSKTQFQGAEFRGTQFQGARLLQAQFQGATFEETKFQKAKLSGAQFQGAEFLRVQFQRATLTDAQFQGASLEDVEFHEAYLLRAQFQGAKFWGAQFHGARFPYAQFQKASLPSVQFRGVDLSEAQFQGADLDGAEFQGACLSKVQFQEASFNSTKFQGAFSREISASNFLSRIINRINEKADLPNVIFAGGLTQGAVDKIIAQLGGIKIPKNVSFKEILQKHVGQPASNIPPEGVETGEYSQEEADQWIAEYEKAMNWERDA